MLALALGFSFFSPHLATVWPNAVGEGARLSWRSRAFLVMGRLGVSHHHVVGAADFLGVAVALLHLHHLALEVIGIIVSDPFR